MITHKPFYLLRHGLSEANKSHMTAGGMIDSPLAEEGHAQALAVARILELEKPQISRIFHSPMQRAHKTATLANTHIQLEMEAIETLHEILLGDWEGLPWAEVEPFFNERVSPPNGEDETQHVARVRATIDSILTLELEAPPLIVAHGGTFHAIGLAYGYAMQRINNCHLHYFEPWPENQNMPWKLTAFDLNDDNKVVKSVAPSCPTHQNIISAKH
jgi:broad specificity phosphatase PhoE|tara:strand:+ start:147594 stop:148241 length:648 start_codon:yes stop_codon:yes gene_type:complete